MRVEAQSGTFGIDQTITFEVVSFSDALDEFEGAMQQYLKGKKHPNLVLKELDGVRRALAQGQPLTAADRFEIIGMLLSSKRFPDKPARANCIEAARQMEAVLRRE